MSHSGSSYRELTSRRAAADEHRDVTAVSIPGRFLPAAAAAAAPAGITSPAADSSAEIAAAVHRLVASTDDAALGLTGFCWDAEEGPAAPPERRAVAALQESTPLPLPALPAAEFLADEAAPNAKQPALPPPAEQERAPLDFFAAPVGPALPTREAARLPSEAAPPPSEVAMTSRAVPSIGSAPEQLPNEDELPDEDEDLPSEAAARQIYSTSLAISFPEPSPVVPGPDEAAWAPVGFSPEMVAAEAPPASAVALPARSAETPVSVSSVPVAVAALPAKKTTAPAEPRPGNALQGVVWAGMLRLGLALRRWGQTARCSGQALGSSGLARLRAGLPQVRLFGERVRQAVARIALRFAWPVSLRTAVPWLLAGGAALTLILILLTLRSCGGRAKQKRALQRGVAIATQRVTEPARPVGAAVPPQAIR